MFVQPNCGLAGSSSPDLAFDERYPVPMLMVNRRQGESTGKIVNYLLPRLPGNNVGLSDESSDAGAGAGCISYWSFRPCGRRVV